MDRGEAMLKVVQDIYDGGKDLIPNWLLLEHAKDSLKSGGPDGLKLYYERCLNSPKGKGVKARLERHGRKTLESERPRFMAVYNSGSR